MREVTGNMCTVASLMYRTLLYRVISRRVGKPGGCSYTISHRSQLKGTFTPDPAPRADGTAPSVKEPSSPFHTGNFYFEILFQTTNHVTAPYQSLLLKKDFERKFPPILNLTT